MWEIRSMRTNTMATASLVLLMSQSVSPGLAADGGLQQIESAKELYESGDRDGSLTALDGAADLIREQKRSPVAELFPDPLQGWQADPPQSRSDPATVAIAGTNVSRRYSREDGAQVKLALLIDPPAFPFLSSAVHGPVTTGKHPGLQPYSLGQWKGTLDQTADGSYAITLVVGDRLIVQARGSRISDPQILTQYLEAMDVDTVLERFDRD
jgi:hypothetical protein